MTKKDYVKIASALYESRIGLDESTERQHRFACFTVSDMLAQDNPRFDRDRFLSACGVQ